jgi:hypothetical protein
MGIRDKPTAPASPWQNGFAERLIGSIRRECVDHFIVLGETHLRRILRSYARYYNEIRTHRSLDKDAPVSRPVQRTGVITSNPILGGLIALRPGFRFSVHTRARLARRNLRLRSKATDAESGRGAGDQLGARSSRGRGLFVRDAPDAWCFQELMVAWFSFPAKHSTAGGTWARSGRCWRAAWRRRGPLSDRVLISRAGTPGRYRQSSQARPPQRPRLLRRDAGRRVLPSNEKGALAGMRIAAVPHPAVLLAFADSAGVEQNRPGPSLKRPEGGPPFLHHQHRNHSCARRILDARLRSRLLTQGRDSQSWELTVFHLFRCRTGSWLRCTARPCR